MREKIQIALIVLLGLILRLLYVQQRGIWYDDAFSILLAKQSLAQIISGTAADTMPPLYYFLLHFWMMVSMKIVWIRLLNLVIFYGVLGFAYQITKHIVSSKAGLIAIFLLSISPFLIYHTQEVRMYMLLAFCQVGYFYYFIRWIDSEQPEKKVYVFGMILFATGALYSHNLAIFGLVIPGIYLLVKRQISQTMHWIVTIIGSLLLFTPWLVLVPGQIEKIQTAFWTPRPGILQIIQSIYSLLSFIPQPSPWIMISGVLSFQILALVLWIGIKRRHQIKHFLLIIFGMIFIPMVLFVVSYLMRPVYVARGFILSLLMFYIFTAIICWINWGGGIEKIILGLFIILSAISLPFQYNFDLFPRSPFAAACTYLTDEINQAIDTNVVLHDNKLSAFPCFVYEPEFPQLFLGDESGSHNDTYAFASQQAMNLYPIENIEQAVSGRDEVYFVVFVRAIDEYAEQGDGNHPALVYLSEAFTQKDIKYFNDLAIYHYAK
ncbi:MAG: glycosyltransferase family 39 protein [Anaerolineaceae bacterium]|nr:glycosyltransferase family 39 protein [Anaerolineaceae bacterium]